MHCLRPAPAQRHDVPLLSVDVQSKLYNSLIRIQTPVHLGRQMT
jgi:hypothetical protein